MSELRFFQARPDGVSDAARLIIEKSLERDEKVLVRTPDAESAKLLDEWLWKHSDGSFVPHGLSGEDDAEEQPVYITAGTEVPEGAVVLLLFDGADASAEEMGKFTRVAVAFDDGSKGEARELWRVAIDNDLQPVLVEQDTRGRWNVQDTPARKPPAKSPAQSSGKPAATSASDSDSKSESTASADEGSTGAKAKAEPSSSGTKAAAPADKAKAATGQGDAGDTAKAEAKDETKAKAATTSKAESSTKASGAAAAKSTTAKSTATAKAAATDGERTLSIIKPDATARDLTGKINAMLEEAGLRIVAQRRLRLKRADAEAFYAVHKGKPFFDELCDFMSSGPIVAQVLQGKDAVQANRKIMGATDPKEADKGTIRKTFAKSIGENSVHGSDSAENATTEIAFFFRALDIVE